MSLKDRFAESFARSKTMSEPEKKANEVLGKILLKKAIIPVVIMFIILIAGMYLKINGWIIFGINIAVAVAFYFYIKKDSEKYQQFTPYVGTLVSLEKKEKGVYTVLIKQGKKPIKLEIAHGGEDLERVKKNQLVQINYNPASKMAIVMTNLKTSPQYKMRG
ncbi:hypothetical protein EXD82_08195 [Peptacetobacter hominis]|uniref:DUF3592 domain-containing protein n=1 Tax=Peptacetobacter hominis TaxID=2743610 RepID=A0A544QU09_9FIRM|nr:hypothetical protein [Peptacetobacter hominis]TQQ84178.1 hypothetical protein EXD82_08195 [Peptacetobacter hominis]